MGLLDAIDKLITERGSAAVMRERADFIREQAQALEKKMTELQAENATLKKRVAELEAQVAAQTARDEFVECRGALFKRKPTGGYHNAVFCPDCHGPMMSLMDQVPFHCSRCRRSVGFTGHDLRQVLMELP